MGLEYTELYFTARIPGSLRYWLAVAFCNITKGFSAVEFCQ